MPEALGIVSAINCLYYILIRSNSHSERFTACDLHHNSKSAGQSQYYQYWGIGILLYGNSFYRDTLLFPKAIKQSGVILTRRLFAAAQSVLLQRALSRRQSRRSINNNIPRPSINLKS